MRLKFSKFSAALIAIAILLTAARAEARPQRRAPRAAQDEPSPLRPGRPAPISHQTLYVDPAVGSDRQAGSQRQPFQTITHALSVAQPNTVILLAPGDYSLATGETFPLQLQPGVTLQGGPGRGGQPATIRGGGEFDSPARSQQNAAIRAADRSGLAHVAIVNTQGHGIWIEAGSPTILESVLFGSQNTGIYVVNGAPTIQNSYFSQNGMAGLVIFGDSPARIQGNTFEATGVGITVAAGAAPEISNNRIIGNETGLMLLGNVQPVLRNNEITGNQRNGAATERPNQPEAEPETKTTAVENARSISQPSPLAAAETLPTVTVTPPASRWPEVTTESGDFQIADRPRPRILEDRGPNLDEPEPLDTPTPPLEARPPRPSANSERLRVPPSPIPMGSGGGLYNFSPPSRSGGPPVPPTRAATLGLHYKVFVEARGEAAQARVRQVIPDAFRARFDGEELMQVGAFPNEEEAIARSQLLLDNGFEVRVEYVP